MVLRDVLQFSDSIEDAIGFAQSITGPSSSGSATLRASRHCTDTFNAVWYRAKDLRVFDPHQLAQIMHQMALGIVHRDLAARNVLVGENLMSRSRILGCLGRCSSRTTTRFKSYGLVALRCTAVKALQALEWTTASDVYSHGVVISEVYSFGQCPFADLDDIEVVELCAFFPFFFGVRPDAPIASRLVFSVKGAEPDERAHRTADSPLSMSDGPQGRSAGAGQNATARQVFPERPAGNGRVISTEFGSYNGAAKGALFYVDRVDGLHRIAFVGAQNRAPTAVAAAVGPTFSVAAPLVVQFDASGSTDIDGDSLVFSWDFEGRGHHRLHRRNTGAHDLHKRCFLCDPDGV